MTRAEYKETLNYELYRGKKYNLTNRLRIKYIQPNTNCMFMARRMWHLYEMGGVYRLLSAHIYLRIIRKYGCCIYRNIKVGKGFFITHPIGIVIGKCTIGENFTIYQNCTIGVKKYGDESLRKVPTIGNRVWLYTNSIICGDTRIADDVVIGANSIVTNDILESGVYAGNPVAKIH